jgi:hypothetical protein
LTSSGLKPWYRRFYLVLPIVALILLLPGTRVYQSYSSGTLCTSCHEISQSYNEWHTSTHRNVACSSCHGSVFSADIRSHLKSLHRLVSHVRGQIPEQIRLAQDDVQKMGARCQTCHQPEYADWAAGPHAIKYRQIFLDESHNRGRLLVDDCLRCHGMHFEGGIRDLVKPIDTKGPWKLRDVRLAEQPAIPCIACHQVHRSGDMVSREALNSSAKTIQPTSTPSLALFDRRELEHIPIARLSLPVMHEGNKDVEISSDPRQALCYQCHAPAAYMQVGSGDDRTPVGVHQGISCFACHRGHGEKTQASCSTCHPQPSNRGLTAGSMDEPFKSAASVHNIHSAKLR